jgi:predicted SAM-dependent methyltransferase
MKKVQFGCGSNFLQGWENYDSEIDITKPLPFNDNSIDYIFCEHVIEHIEYEEFNNFLVECYRCLKGKGRMRLTAPFLDKILKMNNKEYFKWSSEKYYKKEPTYCNTVNSLFRLFGHKYIYDKETIEILLKKHNFNNIKFYDPGFSDDAFLNNIERHWKKIGVEFNNLESIAVESEKQDKY